MKFWAVIMAITFLHVGASSAQSDIGDKVADFKVKDIRYLPRTLADFGEKEAFAFIFYANECPEFSKYVPLLNKLDTEYHQKNVQLALINVGKNDSIMDVALFAMENDIAFPVLKDMDGECAKAMGVTKYPALIVLDKSHSIVYRGKIAEDSQLSTESAGESILRSVLDAVLAGSPVQTPETPIEGCTVPSFALPQLDYKVSYAEHVAPIIQEHCVACHRPNGIGPFSLATYAKLAGNAEMVKEVVWEERMPPWYAHPAFGDFENDRTMSDEEKAIIANWVIGGMEEGDTSKLPEMAEYPDEKWLTNPDLILTAKQQVALPATGFLPYQYLSFDHVFEQDSYVQAIEIMPENPRVVHHANVFYTQGAFGFDRDLNFLTGKVPGSQPSETHEGIAWLIPAGSVLRIQVHYVTTGKAETDRMQLGLRFAKETINKRLYYTAMEDRGKINIPPGERAWLLRDSDTVDYNVTAIGLFGHLHLRGKHFKIDATYPDGTIETLFAMPNYNFGWQMTYHYPYGEKKFPAGTKVESFAWYDNSPFNPYNPDAGATVTSGPQSHDEMLNGFFVYTRDDENLGLQIDPQTGFVIEKLAAIQN